MIEIGDGIFVETGFDGVNVAAIVTREGIVCIDAPSYPRDARDWVIQLERVHAQPIRLLILTDCHGDRILNTRWFHAPILAQRSVAEQLNSYEKRYPQYLLDSLYRRNPTRSRELPHSPVQRPSLSFTNELSLLIPPYSINLSHRPGPTAANTWITIPEEGILFVGDSVVSGTMPILAEMRWHDWMDSLNQLESTRDAYKVVVPGRGDIANVNAYRDMIAYLQTIERTVLIHAEEELSLADLTIKAHDLVATFPTDNLPVDWMTDEIARGLEQAYEQLVVEDGHGIVVPADREPN